MKMGAIAVPAMLGTVRSAAAGNGCPPLDILCWLGLGVATAPATGTETETRVGGGKCFLKGTKIQTAEGERKTEDLAIGDLLPTMFGGLRPVQWIVTLSN